MLLLLSLLLMLLLLLLLLSRYLGQCREASLGNARSHGTDGGGRVYCFTITNKT